MEVINAREVRDRCLAAMAVADDVDTKRELWRAAVQFNREIREESGAGLAAVIAGPHLAAAD
jgi:hypothetical protein